MKGTQWVFTIWILGQQLCVPAHAYLNAIEGSHLSLPRFPSLWEGLGARRRAHRAKGTASTSVPSSSSSAPSSTPHALRTTTLVISHSTRASSTNSPSSSARTAGSTSPTPPFDAMATGPVNGLGPSNPNFAPDTPTSSGAESDPISAQRRTLIIVLSSVLGSIAILLISVAIFLACRYRKRRAPFRRRGVTPIDDDEIESWRGSEQKQKPILEAGSTQTPRGASIDSTALKHSPGWIWAASPNTLHSMNSPGSITEPPDFIARAPNSRVGLTDEAVPGADAFIPPMKRQSSRLSKAPPGHGRSKSRRSSISAKSVRSYTGGLHSDFRSKERIPTWYDPDNESVGTYLRDTENTNSSPGTSVFDALSVGGLSPRPKSRNQQRPWGIDEKEIGRAIA